MANSGLNRRDVLRYGAALGITGALAARAARADETGRLGDEPETFTLVVDIPGLPCASESIREVEIEPLTIDPPAIPGGRGLDLRVYAPGDAHYGHARFTSACTLGGSKELQTWFQEAAKGKDIRKNITVTLFKSDKTPGRSYLLDDCFPVSWSAVNFDTSSTVQTESLTVKIGRIEFKV